MHTSRRNDEERVARELFTTGSTRLRRRPLRSGWRRDGTSANPIGLLIFTVLLGTGTILLPLVISDSHQLPDYSDITNSIDKFINEDVPKFFSSEPLNITSNNYWINFNGKYIYGVVNTLHCSVAIGLAVAIVTYFAMFYDSHVPGSFPQSPFSPKRRSRSSSIQVGLAFGYQMVPVNGFVFTLIAMYIVRIYFNVPFY